MQPGRHVGQLVRHRLEVPQRAAERLPRPPCAPPPRPAPPGPCPARTPPRSAGTCPASASRPASPPSTEPSTADAGHVDVRRSAAGRSGAATPVDCRVPVRPAASPGTANAVMPREPASDGPGEHRVHGRVRRVRDERLLAGQPVTVAVAGPPPARGTRRPSPRPARSARSRRRPRPPRSAGSTRRPRPTARPAGSGTRPAPAARTRSPPPCSAGPAPRGSGTAPSPTSARSTHPARRKISPSSPSDASAASSGTVDLARFTGGRDRRQPARDRRALRCQQVGHAGITAVPTSSTFASVVEQLGHAEQRDGRVVAAEVLAPQRSQLLERGPVLGHRRSCR